MFSSRVYESWREIQQEKYRAILQFPIFSGRIIDIGGGKRYLEKFLLDDGVKADIICADIEEPADVLGDGGRLPFRDEIFDTVISIDSMHLIEGRDFERVLKKGGFALLALFFNDENYGQRKNLLKEKLQGFEILTEFEQRGKQNEYVILGKKLHPV